MADFNEADHPRGDNGQFTSGGGGGRVITSKDGTKAKLDSRGNAHYVREKVPESSAPADPPKQQQKYQSGDKVLINRDPYKGFPGTVVKEQFSPAHNKMLVHVRFGRMNRVIRLGHDDLEKLDMPKGASNAEMRQRMGLPAQSKGFRNPRTY